MLTSEPCAPGIRGCAHDWLRGFSAILSMALALSLLTAPLAADAQPSAQVPRIGFLFPGPASLASLRLEPFRQALRELGYIEGQNIAIETRWAEGKLDRLPELATELVRLKVNVIMTAATPAAKAAKHATTTIPIVMVDPGDPVSTGLVASLARPGGNATGLSSVTPDVAAKNLELLKAAVPQVSRVAFLWNAASPVAELALKEVQVAARSLAVQLQSVDVRVRTHSRVPSRRSHKRAPTRSWCFQILSPLHTEGRSWSSRSRTSSRRCSAPGSLSRLEA